jgi:ICE2
MWILRVFFSATYLTAIVLSIPLAFDVGGKTCGLAYSLSLASFYFLFSILRLATPDDSRFRRLLVFLVSSTQWLIVPALLIWSLNLFSVDSKSRNDASSWIDSYGLKGSGASQNQVAWDDASTWTFGLMESLTIGSWDKLLRWSSPFFQLVEGFCSLLVIQAAGQITRWLVNRSGGGDTWMVCLQFLTS